jgi:uracil-DNA glycosylase family 4
MSNRRQLAEHLRLLAEWGVSGVNRDRSWRERQPAAGGGSGEGPEQSAAPAAATPSQPDASTPVPTATTAGLADVRADIGECVRCALHALGRRQIVFGVGNPTASLMFVGEAPGADEDAKGEPFVGRAGQLLTKIIEAIELRREDVYIANVIKCRPPGNRNPEPAEVEQCSPFLLRQIEVVKPKVIVALGTFAAHMLLGSDAPISRLRGRVHDFRNGIKLVPTFHPAYLLRSPERKRDVWEDMKIVRGLLAAHE